MDETNEKALESLRKQLDKLDSIETKHRDSLHKKSKEIVSNLDSSNKNLEKTLRDSDSVSDMISKTNKEMSHVNDSLSDIEKSDFNANLIKLTNGFNSLRGGFRNFVFSMSEGLGASQDFTSFLNLVSNISDLLLNWDAKIIELNKTYIKGYAALGNLNQLDIGGVAERMSNIRNEINNFGYTNDEVDQAVNSFIDAGGDIKSLEKSLERDLLSVKYGVRTTSGFLASFSRDMGLEVSQTASYMGKLQYSFGVGSTSYVEAMDNISSAQKGTNIASSSFIEAVMESVESSKQFGLDMLGNARVLSYLGRNTQSASNALEMFNETLGEEESSGMRLPMISELLKSNTKDAITFRKELLSSLNKRLMNTDEGTSERFLLEDLVKGVEDVQSGKSGYTDQLLLLLNKAGAMPRHLTVALDSLVASEVVPRDKLRSFAYHTGSNYELLREFYGKSMSQIIDKMDSDIEELNATQREDLYASNIKAGSRAKTVYQKIEDFLENSLLKGFGGYISEMSQDFKKSLLDLTSNKYFNSIFSSDISTSGIFKFLIDSIRSVTPASGVTSSILSPMLDASEALLVDESQLEKEWVNQQVERLNRSLTNELDLIKDKDLFSDLAGVIGDKKKPITNKEILDTLSKDFMSNESISDKAKERLLTIRDNAKQVFEEYKYRPEEVTEAIASRSSSGVVSEFLEYIKKTNSIQEELEKKITKKQTSMEIDVNGY